MTIHTGPVVDQGALDEWDAFIAQVLVAPAPPIDPEQPAAHLPRRAQRRTVRWLYPAYALIGILVITATVALAEPRAFGGGASADSIFEEIIHDPLALLREIGGFFGILARAAVGAH